MVAVASFLDARSQNGRWLLRIDDLDSPRVSKDAELEILKSLESHGLYWDGQPVHQLDHHGQYVQALNKLIKTGDTFPCTCRRKDLDRIIGCILDCCSAASKPRIPHTIRIRLSLQDIFFHDPFQGLLNGSASEKIKNIAIWRRDGIPTYPLAVIVDDNIMGVTDIMRGADLVTNTIQQLFLLDKLGLQRPEYAHVPVVIDREGEKLSKRNEATTVDSRHARQNVIWTMQLLGMDPPQTLALDELLNWGIENWSRSGVRPQLSLTSFVSV